MWTPSTWHTEEDVERDIRLLAEYSIPTAEDLDPSINKVPDTILQYRQKMAKNKEKPLNSDLDDNVAYIVSGRGKGIKDRVIRPGGIIDCHPLDDLELKKKIRQVAGFGYSNEFIEQSIKSNSYQKEDIDDDDTNIKLVSSSSSNKSSNNASPSRKKTGC